MRVMLLRRPLFVAFSFPLTASANLADAQPLSLKVKVEASERQTAAGYVYSYRVINSSSLIMAGLELGFDTVDYSTELLTSPQSIQSPPGWTGEMGTRILGGAGVWIDWGSPALDSSTDILPGATLEGYSVLVPRQSPEYLKAVFTARFTNSAYFVGNVVSGQVVEAGIPLSVLVTAPQDDSVVSGLVELSAAPSDAADVTSLRFEYGAVSDRIGAEITTPPFTTTWDTRGIEYGTFPLTAIVRDNEGREYRSPQVHVTVVNQRPDTSAPIVSVQTPEDGTLVEGVVVLSAVAADNVRVAAVRFKLDGTDLGQELTSEPYRATWDSRTTTDGSHVVVAVARDAAGNVTTSAPRTAMVRTGTVNSISETQPAKLWLGLKNSDDQGTAFDLQVVLAVNGTRVADGEVRCVAGLTRNAAKSRETVVAIGPISNPALLSGDTLSLTISTRIGTNPDGSRCPGHSNAVGLRLYFDAVNRPSQFGARITPDPLRNFFLRSIGPSFTLDSTSPNALSAKEKDSGPVNYANGNPWTEIGSWSRSIP